MNVGGGRDQRDHDFRYIAYTKYSLWKHRVQYIYIYRLRHVPLLKLLQVASRYQVYPHSERASCERRVETPDTEIHSDPWT